MTKKAKSKMNNMSHSFVKNVEKEIGAELSRIRHLGIKSPTELHILTPKNIADDPEENDGSSSKH